MARQRKREGKSSFGLTHVHIYTLILDVGVAFFKYNVHVFHLSLNRNNGEPEKNWLLEKSWRDKEREKGKFHLELHAHTYTL